MTQQNTMPDEIYCSLWAAADNPPFLIGPWLDLRVDGSSKYLRADTVPDHTSLLKQARDELNDTIPFIGWVPRDPQEIIDKITKTITAIDAALGEKK